jgi:hypothetical protein
MRLRKIVTGALLVGFGAVVGPQIAMAAITATNSCDGCASTTGDASAGNASTSTVGQSAGPGGTNVQDGDNSLHEHQGATSLSGDANSGQVVGSVGGGASSGAGGGSITASNACTDCTADSGKATSGNTSTSTVGQSAGPDGSNVQEGDNHAHSRQSSSSQSGDANSGQVVGQSR